MHGRLRNRKKQLIRAGWQVVADSRVEKNYRLVLRNSSGEQVTVEAASRPRAYAKAEQQLGSNR
jgi:hypothetical protein